MTNTSSGAVSLETKKASEDESSAKKPGEIENNLSAIRILEQNYPEYREANLALIG